MNRFIYLFFLCVGIFSSLIGEETIPVVFIHKTNSSYLKISLWQARQFNKRIILIGDKSNELQKHCEHYLMDDYSKEANAFKDLYVHKSTSGYEYELFCYQRWFVLKEFMEENNLNKVFYCDSDVMLYCNVQDEYKNYSPEDFLIGYWGEYGSGHSSYFTLSQIQKFCDYMTFFYKNFDSYKDKSYVISDMFVFGQYVKDESIPVCDLMIVPTKEGVFDLNISSHHGEYEMKEGLKAIQWIQGIPYCYNSKIGKNIRFKSLHFQGTRKSLMKMYRVGNKNALEEFKNL